MSGKDRNAQSKLESASSKPIAQSQETNQHFPCKRGRLVTDVRTRTDRVRTGKLVGSILGSFPAPVGTLCQSGRSASTRSFFAVRHASWRRVSPFTGIGIGWRKPVLCGLPVVLSGVWPGPLCFIRCDLSRGEELACEWSLVRLEKAQFLP